MRELERHEPCAHENWTRGGVIWRICDDCGANTEEGHEWQAQEARDRFVAAADRIRDYIVGLEAENKRLLAREAQKGGAV